MKALAAVLLLGVALRLALPLHWPRRLNVDEATAGLMGLHVLRGEFPVSIYSVADQGIRLGFWSPHTDKRLRVGDTPLPHGRHDVRLTTVRILPPS